MSCPLSLDICDNKAMVAEKIGNDISSFQGKLLVKLVGAEHAGIADYCQGRLARDTM